MAKSKSKTSAIMVYDEDKPRLNKLRGKKMTRTGNNEATYAEIVKDLLDEKGVVLEK